MLGGEIAALELIKYIKPATCTLYIEPHKNHLQTVADHHLKPAAALTRLAAAHHFRADPKGDIEVLDTFWHLPRRANEPHLVPPVLVYADLMATLDPRNLETAKLIRDNTLMKLSLPPDRPLDSLTVAVMEHNPRRRDENYHGLEAMGSRPQQTTLYGLFASPSGNFRISAGIITSIISSGFLRKIAYFS